jgi:hypothetical protein
MEKHYTYIIICGCSSPPHIIHKYVPNKLIGREISNKTMEEGIIGTLSAINKRTWPKFPIRLRGFTLIIVLHAKKEEATLKELILC